MAHVKIQCVKFVFFLLCLSQVQAAAKLSERSDNPFDELIKEIAKSANRISDKLQLRLNEADINVNKYIEQTKDKIKNANEDFQQFLEKLELDVEKFQKQLCDIIPNQYERLISELKAKDPETAEKVKKLKEEVMSLKDSVKQLYEDIKKKFTEHFNDLKEDFIVKSKPIAKRLTPIVKEFEEIILTLIPDKKKAIK